MPIDIMVFCFFISSLNHVSIKIYLFSEKIINNSLIILKLSVNYSKIFLTSIITLHSTARKKGNRVE